ncbi:MAG: hypothetical protein AAB583_06370, partial [Patescibacteria group bacterium]
TGKETIDAIRHAMLAPTKPKSSINGATIITRTIKLINVTAETYFCFLTARKRADVEPEIPLTIPNNVRILRKGTTSSHFSPKKRRTTSSVKPIKTIPNKTLETLTSQILFKNAILNLSLS